MWQLRCVCNAGNFSLFRDPLKPSVDIVMISPKETRLKGVPYLSLLRDLVRDLLLGILSRTRPIRGRGGEGLWYFLDGGDRLNLLGDGVHLLLEEEVVVMGGDTEGPASTTLFSCSLERLLERRLLSGDLPLLLGGLMDLLLGGLTDLLSFSLSLFALSRSLERLLDRLLLFTLLLSTGERLLDFLLGLDSFGDLLLFLSFSLWPLGEWLLERFLCFFLGGDLLLEREERLGDLDIAVRYVKAKVETLNNRWVEEKPAPKQTAGQLSCHFFFCMGMRKRSKVKLSFQLMRAWLIFSQSACLWF